MLLLSASPACVVPVVPEFENPPEAINYAPRIISLGAPPGDTLRGPQQSLSIQVYDPNPGDVLFVRHLFDFPPDGPNTRPQSPRRIAAPVGANMPREVGVIPVSCDAGNLVPFIPVHKVTVIVADQEFDLLSSDPFALKGKGETDQDTWFYEQICPP